MMKISAAIIVGFFGLQSAAFAQNPIQCSGGKNIFVIDRTSALNESEEYAFRDGVRVLFSNLSFSGHMEIAEVRSSALTFKWIYEGCVEGEYDEPATCEEYFKFSRSEIISSQNPSFFSNPLDWLSTIFQSDNHEFSDELVFRCEEDRDSFFARRLAQQTKVLEDVVNAGTSDISESSTALAETIFGVVSSRCSKSDCNLYVFSNLLDNGWQDIIKRPTTARQDATSYVVEHPFFDRNTSKVNDVVVWGFGFNELNSNEKFELRADEASVLKEYWTYFFSAIASGLVSIQFEIPR